MLILVPIVALLELHAVANHVRQRPRLGNAFSEAMRPGNLIVAEQTDPEVEPGGEGVCNLLVVRDFGDAASGASGLS
jgi:hypothetical protein